MIVRPEFIDSIGNKPPIAARHSAPTGRDIYDMAEYLDPGSWVKDRAALPIIEDAERSGKPRAWRCNRRGHGGQHRHRHHPGRERPRLPFGDRDARDAKRRICCASSAPTSGARSKPGSDDNGELARPRSESRSGSPYQSAHQRLEERPWSSCLLTIRGASAECTHHVVAGCNGEPPEDCNHRSFVRYHGQGSSFSPPRRITTCCAADGGKLRRARGSRPQQQGTR
jgi:hypothetical protein